MTHPWIISVGLLLPITALAEKAKSDTGHNDKKDSGSDTAAMANVALAISIISAVICLFQVLQQYGTAGSPLRLCDSIVYGGSYGLPGKGRRTWVWKQFRFRIIYDMPRISLAPLNPNLGVFVPYLIRPSPSFDWPAPEQLLMSQLRKFGTKPQVGEAAWVSFCRVLIQACPGSVIVNRVRGDADRCPLDMTVIPMPVSMRDMAFFGLSIGMECVEASFSTQSMTMRGPIGVITSSQHSLLGPVLHYTPPQDGFKLPKIGTKIDPAWILRVCGRIRVGNTVLKVGDTVSMPGDAKTRNLLQLSEEFTEEAVGDAWSQLTDLVEDDSRRSRSSTSDEKASLSEIPKPSHLLTSLNISRMDWYWLSQIPVISGFWATPFKSHVRVDVCWGAQATILRTIYSLFPHDTVGGLPPVTSSTLENLQITGGSNLTSFPPYGATSTSESMSKEIMDTFAKHFEFADSASFDGHIPKLEIRKASLSPPAHAALDDHRLCTIDVMSLDVWLGIVGKTEPIFAGMAQLKHQMPPIIRDIMNTMTLEFAKIDIGSDRSSMDAAVSSLKDAMRAAALSRCRAGLSGAEEMYVLAALLRTVKVGLCVGLGNDTTPLLEIIRRDIQAHLL